MDPSERRWLQDAALATPRTARRLFPDAREDAIRTIGAVAERTNIDPSTSGGYLWQQKFCLVEDIRKHKKMDLQVSTCAARMQLLCRCAKTACQIDEDFEVLRESPNFLGSLLDADNKGVAFPGG